MRIVVVVVAEDGSSNMDSQKNAPVNDEHIEESN
jgi:hypothetical protein